MMPVRLSHRVFGVGLAVASLTGCGGSQTQVGAPGAMPQAAATVRHAGGFPKCPHGFLGCVWVAYGSPGSTKICWENGCKGYGPPLYWRDDGAFRIYPAGPAVKGTFAYSFGVNPGNPSEDTITEIKQLKSSHGKVGYEQRIWGCPKHGPCKGPFTIGIIIQ
jgi:hypothetical protein